MYVCVGNYLIKEHQALMQQQQGRPTQLIYISDIYLSTYILNCQHTNIKDIAGQSAEVVGKIH